MNTPSTSRYSLDSAPATLSGLPKAINLRSDILPGRRLVLQTERGRHPMTVLVHRGRALTLQSKAGDLVSYHA